MRTWLPFPLTSLCLLGMWLMLNQSLSVGHVLLGALFALLGGWLLGLVQRDVPRVRNPLAMARLGLLVFVDIVRSNIAVARIILGPRHSQHTSGFLKIPLDLRNRYGLAILGCIITATPGTLWVRYNAETQSLLIHVLDLVDEATWIDTIKGRYERLLLEIFE